MKTLLTHLVIAILPLVAASLLVLIVYLWTTTPSLVDTSGLQTMGMESTETTEASTDTGGLQEPEGSVGLAEPPAEEPGQAAQVAPAAPTEAAAMGSFGGFVLAAAYKQLNFTVVKESVFLTAKTSAMVCWLFVGSGIFAGAFALLGGQEIINAWVQSLDMTPVQFTLMAQFIIFLLGWPLEWTEIIIIFMPIFLPLLTHFNIDPLFFGLLVALNQIFLGMLPFMAIQVIAIFLLYMFPQIGLWLPSMVYGH